MPPLNALLDEYEKRVHGTLARVPLDVMLVLLVTSSACAFLVGRSEGASLQKQPRMMLIFLLAAFVFYASLDLDQPWRGFIQVSELPMERLERSLGAR